MKMLLIGVMACFVLGHLKMKLNVPWKIRASMITFLQAGAHLLRTYTQIGLFAFTLFFLTPTFAIAITLLYKWDSCLIPKKE